jgi:hypothetical protein
VAEGDPIILRSSGATASIDLTDILYQRDGEIIAFARPDPAVSGTGSLFVAQAVDI